MIQPLISFELAKSHLRIIGDDQDNDIDSKLRLASLIVLNHCKLTTIPDAWITDALDDFDSEDLVLVGDPVSPDTSPPSYYYVRVPGNIQAATMLVLSDLFENRESSTTQVLSDAVINLLAPFRDPTMA